MHKLREHIANFDWSLKSIVKASIALVVLVVALAIVLGVLNTVAKSVFGYRGYDNYDRYDSGVSVTDGFLEEIGGNLGFGGGVSSKSMFATQEADFMGRMAEPAIAPFPYDEGGEDAEEYERRNYDAYYETRKFEETCTTIDGLKPLEYVVFDHSSKSEDWCNYSFRVEVEHEDEIIDVLKGLDPRDFNIDTSTIERSVEYHDSELAMQERRLASTQETLDQAEESFNSLIARATREGDTKTLSEVINNKISTVERLNQQILNTQERIDRLTKGRGEQIEQIEYAHFNASVSKTTFFDGERFSDEWKSRVQELFVKVNATLLALTVGLVSFALGAVEVVVFAAIAIVAITIFAKIMWTLIKRIWGWQPKSRMNDQQM